MTLTAAVTSFLIILPAELPAKPVEELPAEDPPQASLGQQPKPPEIAQLREEAPAQLSLFAP